MMEKIRSIFRKRKMERENGSADLITTIFLTPFAIILILVTLDVGLYMNTRSHAEASLRDGVRQAAMWGGTGNAAEVRLNKSGKTTQQNILDQLWDDKLKICTQSHCSTKPVVTCDAAARVVQSAGTKIRCTVKYSYQSIVPGSSLLGFADITNKAFTIQEYAVSETGYGR